MIWLLSVLGVDGRRDARIRDHAASTGVVAVAHVGAIYYFVLEGCWGASLGKRLMGLRVTLAREQRLVAAHWPAHRRVPYASAHSHSSHAGRHARIAGPERRVYGECCAERMALEPAALRLVSLLLTVLLWLLTILLFSTARRGNGWTGVHELLSRTRVVQRNVRPVASAAPKASPADLGPALSSLRRVGPYAVHTTVGETGGGRLFVGIDPILRRHVWIHEVAPGTPPVDADPA